jgi:hypothetical protein
MTGRELPGPPGMGRLKKAGKQEIFIRLIPDSYIRAQDGPIFVC